jgi:hypothetical protein
MSAVTTAIKRIYEPTGRQLPVPVRSIAEYVHAGGIAVALERAANPTACPTEDMLQLLLGAMAL